MLAGTTGSPVITEQLGLVFHLPVDEMVEEEEEEEEAGTGAKDTDLAIKIEHCITLPPCLMNSWWLFSCNNIMHKHV